MAGAGRRFGGELPKQFLRLGKKRIYLYTLDVFARANVFDEIILVCHPDWTERVAKEAPKASVVAGGETRQQSSYLGLQSFTSKPDIVVIHDAVRPFVSEDILLDNIRGAILHGAVDTCIPSADTLVHAPEGHKIDHIPKRENYLRGQTPQTFQFECIRKAHESALADGVVNVSDDCQLALRKGLTVHIVKGHENNIKITTKTDFLIAKHIKSALFDKLI